MADPRDEDDLAAFAAHLASEATEHEDWPDLKVQLAHVRWLRAGDAADRVDGAMAASLEALFRAALARNPRYRDARLGLFALLASQGAGNAARAVREEIESLHGDDPAAAASLGLFAFEQGAPDEARAALALAPEDLGPQASRPRLFAARAALADGPPAATARAALVAAYPALAEPFERRRFGAPPGRGQALRRLALFTAEQGSAGRAGRWLAEALDLDLDLAGHRAAEGDLAFAAGDIDAAVLHLAAALEVAPELARPRLTLAFALGVLERPADARLQIEEAIRRNPAYPDLRYHLGILLADQGDAAAAARSLEQALALHPGYLDAAYALGVLRAGQGDDRAAIALFERAQEAGLDHDEIRLELGFARLLAGDREGAADYFLERLRDDAGPTEDPTSSPLLGAAIIAESQGLTDRARDLIRHLDLAADQAVPVSALGAAARRRLALARALADRLGARPRTA